MRTILAAATLLLAACEAATLSPEKKDGAPSGGVTTDAGMSTAVETATATATAIATVTATATGTATGTQTSAAVDPVLPDVTDVTPKDVDFRGGATLTLHGAALTGAASVTVGGQPCTAVTVVADDEITCAAPAHGPGPVDVEVTRTDGLKALLASAITYHRQYLYYPEGASQKISVYRVNADDGSLAAAGSVSTPASSTPTYVGVLDATAYAVLYDSHQVASYAVDPATGGLTEKAGSPLLVTNDANHYPTSLGFSLAGDHMYLVDSWPYRLFSWDVAGDGALTAHDTSPKSLPGGNVIGLAFTPSCVFTSAFHFNAIYGMPLDPATGKPGAATTTALSNHAHEMATAHLPGGWFAYVAVTSANHVAAFKVTEPACTLAAAGTPAPGGSSPFAVAIAKDGRFAYVSDADRKIHVYPVDPQTGALGAEIAGSPFGTTGTTPWALQLDPTGRFLYVPSRADNVISVFAVDRATGALTQKADAAVGATSSYLTVVER